MAVIFSFYQSKHVQNWGSFPMQFIFRFTEEDMDSIVSPGRYYSTLALSKESVGDEKLYAQQ